MEADAMKLLRDESGYVLVLRRPQILFGGKAAEEEVSAPAQAIPVMETARCAVPHCCFYCTWCGNAILLPHDRIGSPFGNPDARKIDVRSIATVCHACRHIGNYSMFRACRGFDTRHKIMHSPNQGETALLTWLQCVESTCTARVPFFARLDDDSSAAQAAVWLWDELTCASGHRIRPVPLDPSIQLPLRSSAGPR
jgi:hypothetical protein